MPRALKLYHGVLAGSPWSSKRTFAWHQPWHVLCRLLLGLDALDVRCGCRKRRLDAGAGSHNGRGKEYAVGTETECSVGSSSTRMRCTHCVKSFLARAKLTTRRGTRSLLPLTEK